MIKPEGVAVNFPRLVSLPRCHGYAWHSAVAGLKYGRFSGRDIYTTSQSERLIRLPLYYGITTEEIDTVCEKIMEWSGKN